MKFVNMPNTHMSARKTCLIAAVDYRRIETAKRLLGVQEIDVNKGDKDGRTPLHFACRNWGFEFLKIVRVKSFLLSFNCLI